MERNAMVAVLYVSLQLHSFSTASFMVLTSSLPSLRHVEYYRGILFLTTNRVKAFDEAFLSRIHVALHFHELTRDARRQVWTAFLKKVGVDAAAFGPHLIDKLAEREVNGRQIKNAVRTASSLAASRGIALSFKHLADTLDAMEEFTAEFAAIGRA